MRPLTAISCALLLSVCLALPARGASSVALANGAVAHESSRSHDHAPRHAPHGIKSRIVRELTELLATAIRQGGDAVGWIIARLDSSAAKAFRKHAGDIADELDRIAKIPDLTVRIVKEKLYYFLVNQLGMNSGTALEIADMVTAALSVVFL